MSTGRYEFRDDEVTRAFAGGSLEIFGQPLHFSVRQIGRLWIGDRGFLGRFSGMTQVVAADPFVRGLTTDPLISMVPQGRHPVSLAIAHLASGEEYVAYARVRFTSHAAVRWMHALFSAEDFPRLTQGEFVGYGVDSGHGSFMGERAAKLLAERLEKDPGFEDTMNQALEANDYWAELCPSEQFRDNVFVFRSGLGDGRYASTFGLDSGGKICELVTDFNIVGKKYPGHVVMHKMMKHAPLLIARQKEREEALKRFSGPRE